MVLVLPHKALIIAELASLKEQKRGFHYKVMDALALCLCKKIMPGRENNSSQATKWKRK